MNQVFLKFPNWLENILLSAILRLELYDSVNESSKINADYFSIEALMFSLIFIY